MGVNGIYGLSGSGMDIESMVKVGMMSKQNEYDKMAQKFTKNEWLKADYLDLSSKITTFNSSTLSQYKMSTTMNARSAESSNSAVKVSANSSAMLMNHKVDVASLSSNAYLISTGEIKRYGSDENSIKLEDILFKNLTLSEDGKTVTSGTTIPYSQSTVAPNGYAVNSGTSSDNSAFSFKISDGTKDDDNNPNEATITFSYAEIKNGATLNDLASKINAAGLNIKASYDTVQDKFSLYNTKGGEENTIKIASAGYTGVAGSAALGFFEELQLRQSVNGEIATEANGSEKKFEWSTAAENASGSSFEATGSNGSIWVDGLRYETTDNKVTVNGITYTALNTTTTETASTDSDGKKTYALSSTDNAANISVTQDTDAIIDKVKSFVSDYNKLLSSLYEKYDEKPNSDYKPLTQTQKEQMKEEQITKWEEKAKAGLLYHDQTLGKVIMNMRNAIAEPIEGVDGKYNSIFSLGVSTTGLKGQLVLDEDKLKKALAEDPDSVYNVFAKLDSNDLDNSAKSGVAQRLGDIFVDATKSIKDRAGSSADITEDSDLNNLLRNLQTKMSNFKKLMNSFEDALYKKYDAMESTIAQLGTQLNFIMGGQS